ncbi:MAG: cyclic-di-AMP receptor [Firmicutes bacterium]|nr:cyclic-di-AMP receptor [Bacillota bacterium]
MKLIMAIIHDEDVGRLITAMNKEGFQVTKLASTGGFLRVGNSTMLMGVNEERLDEALKIVHECCKTKKQMTIANQPYTSSPEGYIPYPIEITAGGATVFVIDVEQFHKF